MTVIQLKKTKCDSGCPKCRETETQRKARITFEGKVWRDRILYAINDNDWEAVDELTKNFKEV